MQNPCYYYQANADYNYHYVAFFHRASKLCLGNHCHPSRRPAAVLPLSWCPCTTTSSPSSTLLVTTSGQDCCRADCFFRLTSARWRALSRHMEIENSEMFSFFSFFLFLEVHLGKSTPHTGALGKASYQTVISLYLCKAAHHWDWIQQTPTRKTICSWAAPCVFFIWADAGLLSELAHQALYQSEKHFNLTAPLN